MLANDYELFRRTETLEIYKGDDAKDRRGTLGSPCSLNEKCENLPRYSATARLCQASRPFFKVSFQQLKNDVR